MTTPREQIDLARAWVSAVANPDVVSELEGVYASISRAVAERGPACWASGRCCNFDRAGHRLYVTGLEAAYTVTRMSFSSSQRDGAGGWVQVPPEAPSNTVSLQQIADARTTGGCPYQVKNLCGVHAVRPLGCRVYFCDRSAQAWQEDLSESELARVRAIHDRFRLEYRYGEWRQMLELVTLGLT